MRSFFAEKCSVWRGRRCLNDAKWGSLSSAFHLLAHNLFLSQCRQSNVEVLFYSQAVINIGKGTCEGNMESASVTADPSSSNKAKGQLPQDTLVVLPLSKIMCTLALEKLLINLSRRLGSLFAVSELSQVWIRFVPAGWLYQSWFDRQPARLDDQPNGCIHFICWPSDH